MASRRIYITLNDNKEKDRIIETYLSQSYSEKDAIKEAIYRLATNNTQSLQNDTNSIEKVQIVSKGDNKMKNNTKKLSNNKVQKGADNTQKVEKAIDDKKVEIDTKWDNEVQKNTDDFTIDLSQFSDEVVEVKVDNDSKDELKKKKLKTLKRFL
ncbi:hypothetical protein [Inediibacterium massiliense]|uniref:hypothetical protein n=1 Tax=Inediibacterium massiliense TaxID=1658111 RepID=UPI0006B5CE8D|nr:hypothetical protein [Inediibacterium massiliense]